MTTFHIFPDPFRSREKGSPFDPPSAFPAAMFSETARAFQDPAAAPNAGQRTFKVRPTASAEEHEGGCSDKALALVVFFLFAIPEEACQKAEGSTGDGPQMADAKDELAVADGFDGPDFFEFSKEEGGGE